MKLFFLPDDMRTETFPELGGQITYLNRDVRIGGMETENLDLPITVNKSATPQPYILPLTAQISRIGSDSSEEDFPSVSRQRQQILQNLTITVLPELTATEQFRDFWGVYGQPISIVAGGFAGGVASLFFDRLKKNKTERFFQ